MALADLEEKKVYGLFCFVVLKVQLKVKAYEKNAYFLRGFIAIPSINQKDAFSISQTI